jgi:hypothetical protein
MDYGIEIYLPQLNSISIAKNGSSVTLGGGTNSKKLTDALWAAGKQTGRFPHQCFIPINYLTLHQSLVPASVSAIWDLLLVVVMVGSRVITVSSLTSSLP